MLIYPLFRYLTYWSVCEINYCKSAILPVCLILEKLKNIFRAWQFDFSSLYIVKHLRYSLHWRSNLIVLKSLLIFRNIYARYLCYSIWILVSYLKIPLSGGTPLQRIQFASSMSCWQNRFLNWFLCLLTNGNISDTGLSVITCFGEAGEVIGVGCFKGSLIFLIFIGPTVVVGKSSWRGPRVEAIDFFCFWLSSVVEAPFLTGIKLPAMSEKQPEIILILKW